MIVARHDTVPKMRRQLATIRAAYAKELERERKARTDAQGDAATRRAWALRSEYDTLAHWIERDSGERPETLPLVL